jgi:hypothetical protein
MLVLVSNFQKRKEKETSILVVVLNGIIAAD